MSNPKRLRYIVLTETYESCSAITNDRKKTSRRLNNQRDDVGVAHCPCLDCPDRMSNPRSLERVTHRRSNQLTYWAQQPGFIRHKGNAICELKAPPFAVVLRAY